MAPQQLDLVHQPGSVDENPAFEGHPVAGLRTSDDDGARVGEQGLAGDDPHRAGLEYLTVPADEEYRSQRDFAHVDGRCLPGYHHHTHIQVGNGHRTLGHIEPGESRRGDHLELGALSQPAPGAGIDRVEGPVHRRFGDVMLGLPLQLSQRHHPRSALGARRQVVDHHLGGGVQMCRASVVERQRGSGKRTCANRVVGRDELACRDAFPVPAAGTNLHQSPHVPQDRPMRIGSSEHDRLRFVSDRVGGSLPRDLATGIGCRAIRRRTSR